MTKEERAAARASAKRRRQEQIRARANAKAKEARNGKVPFYKRWARGIAKWVRDMRSELKKVVWPSRKQIINNSLVAIVVIVIFAIVVWGFDQLANQAISALISLGG